jgi:hypothetical protein
MSKNIEKKFKKIIENSDPQELENKFVNYTIEAMDEVLNGNKDSLKKLDTALKFFKDYKHINPDIYARASKRINEHVFNVISKNLEDAQLSNYELKLFINLMGIIDLMTLNYITDLIINYQEEKDESYLENAKNSINELKNMKISMLNDEIFPEAMAKLNEIPSDHPELNETHEEFIKDVKKDIKDQNLNKKNSSRKSK